MSRLRVTVSADPIIRMSCEACDTTIEVPFDSVGELFAADFEKRHAEHEIRRQP